MPLDSTLLIKKIMGDLENTKKVPQGTIGFNSSGQPITGALNTPPCLPNGDADLVQIICKDIIEHIMSNALVTVAVTTAGSATAQTGTGTGTIS